MNDINQQTKDDINFVRFIMICQGIGLFFLFAAVLAVIGILEKIPLPRTELHLNLFLLFTFFLGGIIMWMKKPKLEEINNKIRTILSLSFGVFIFFLPIKWIYLEMGFSNYYPVLSMMIVTTLIRIYRIISFKVVRD